MPPAALAPSSKPPFRRWAKAWSPEQIARRLRLDLPEDETMRISHEAIYRALYVQSQGALRRELTTCLRTERVPRARSRGRCKSHVGPEVLISHHQRSPGYPYWVSSG